ncbi:MAG: zinc-ribbon domain-containing protein [Sphingomonadales bacterium]
MIITCPNCQTRYSLPQEKIKPGGQKVRCAKCGTVWHQEQEEEPIPLAAEQAVPAAPVAPVPDPAWSPSAPAEPPPVAVQPPAAPQVTPPVPDEPVAAPAPAPESAPTAEPAQPERPDSFASFHVRTSAEQQPSGKGRMIAVVVIILLILAMGVVVLFKQQIQDLTGLPLVSMRDLAPPATAPPATMPAEPDPVPAATQPLTLTFDEVESSIEEIDGIRRLMVKGLIVNPADHEQNVPPLAFNMLDKDGKAIDRWSFAAPVKALAPHTTTRFSSQRDTPPTTLHELVPGFDVPENPAPEIEAPIGAQPAAGASAAAPQSAAPQPASP